MLSSVLSIFVWASLLLSHTNELVRKISVCVCMFSDPEYQDEIVQHAKSLDHARANQLINEEHRAHVKNNLCTRHTDLHTL